MSIYIYYELDPDQSIFGWRNADTRLFKRLEHEYENTAIVNLHINYRSTKMIIASASHVVNKGMHCFNSLFTYF